MIRRTKGHRDVHVGPGRCLGARHGCALVRCLESASVETVCPHTRSCAEIVADRLFRGGVCYRCACAGFICLVVPVPLERDAIAHVLCIHSICRSCRRALDGFTLFNLLVYVRGDPSALALVECAGQRTCICVCTARYCRKLFVYSDTHGSGYRRRRTGIRPASLASKSSTIGAHKNPHDRC
eukprot:COSAG01_NODE_2272_length_8023_cov_2.962140_8_plen_182_part_00